jgi:DNA invertase Pin-like site-specific DNA recombinase
MKATTTKFVAYYRVSTKKQGASGLGLEAQQEAARRHLESVGGKLVAEFTEVESGRGTKKRVKLLAALAHCRAAKATLIVAKLDRLSRNVAFLSALMESDVPFVCCDNPHATPLTLHVLAAVAQQEATATSIRTIDALAAAKRRGVKLGSARRGHWSGSVAGSSESRVEARLRGAEAGNEESAAARHTLASKHHAAVVGAAAARRALGMSWAEVAASLNAEGFTTRRGNEWNAPRIHEVMKAFGAELLGKVIPVAVSAWPAFTTP